MLPYAYPKLYWGYNSRKCDNIPLAASIAVGACGEKETKTLYGSWEPILQADTSNIWVASDANFIISVTGSCEAIEVNRTEKGDLANPDVAMPDAKCSGNRDVLTYADNTNDDGLVYELKMDASKDTLIGTATYHYSNRPEPYVLKIKMLRIQ